MRLANLISFSIILIILSCIESAAGSGCSSVNVGKATSPDSSWDVVKAGKVSEFWTKGSISKPMVQAEDTIDYFYVQNDIRLDVFPPIFVSLGCISLSSGFWDPKSSMVSFNTSDQLFMNVNFQLKEEGSFKVLEVEYKCYDEGGSLIDVEMTLAISECPSPLKVYWRKLCGNPISTIFKQKLIKPKQCRDRDSQFTWKARVFRSKKSLLMG